MTRTMRTIIVALAVPVVLIVIAAAFQYVLYALPFFAIYFLRIEDEGVMGAVAWSVWGGGLATLGVIAYGLVRRVARFERNRVGVWTGSVAYLGVVMALALLGPSMDSPIGVLASTQVFTAVPVLLGIAVAWVRRSSAVCATRSGAPRVPRRGSRSGTRRDPA